MKEIKTSFGSLYIEEENDKREEGRIKIYDSLMRYFDYFSLDNLGEGETVASLVGDIINSIEDCSSVEELLDHLCINADYIGSDLMIAAIWALDNSSATEEELLQNEYVNKIGDTYIVLSDYQ